MEKWHLTGGDLKGYSHFDSLISAERAEAYVTDMGRVARHSFYPFIQYHQRYTRFRKKGEKNKVKERPIRYAARLDAYIFSYYRHILSERYESELARLSLESNILAYRQIPAENGLGGKCNIHFARDAFFKIREVGNCCAVALDISSYFESLDHSLLKELWCRMLGVTRLPVDHFQVFKAVTQYAWVQKEEGYERLGHFGDKESKGNLNPVRGYLTPYNDLPKRLCGSTEFREKIARGESSKSVIERNYKPYGIPQGAPISDVLANLYLIDFDDVVARWVREVGGAYYRYSDDLLILVPGGESVGRDLMHRTRELIREHGSKLEIKSEKTSLFAFRGNHADQTFELLDGTKGKNGLEYLGFRYDGKRVYLRNSTITNLRRKIARAANREADTCARRYPDKDVPKLKSLFGYERLIKRFGRVENFGEVHRDYRRWTFWTYAKRASLEFDLLGKPILRQLRRLRASIQCSADKALESAVIRRERRKVSQKK
jgi:hypothetical protein